MNVKAVLLKSFNVIRDLIRKIFVKMHWHARQNKQKKIRVHEFFGNFEWRPIGGATSQSQQCLKRHLSSKRGSLRNRQFFVVIFGNQTEDP